MRTRTFEVASLLCAVSLLHFGCAVGQGPTASATPPTRVASGVPAAALSLQVAPEPADESDNDQTLEDLFLKKTASGRVVPSGYKVCQDRGTNQQFIACGASPCPPGTSMIAWNPGDHPSCPSPGGSYSCVDMKDLGWVRGHKTNFCIARGYDGVKPRPGKYKGGGWCYTGDPSGCGH